MNELTLICCYNNVKMFQNLKDNILTQSIKVQLIGINNTSHKFTSCSSAYNYALNSVNTNYVLFVHQDIVFIEEDCIEKILNYLMCLGDYDILGLAGAKVGIDHVMTNIFVQNIFHYGGSKRVVGLMECDTLDECIFGGKTSCFVEYPFDEYICDDWHLYAVERCLATKKRGDKVFVCDVTLLHLSPGNVNLKFENGFIRLCKYYSNTFKEIRTPCAVSKTDTFSLYLWKFRTKIKRLVSKLHVQ